MAAVHHPIRWHVAAIKKPMKIVTHVAEITR
jgi:hypothetical protein